MKPNILLVDSDLYIHEYFKIIFPELGYDIFMASSVEEGFRMVRDKDYFIYLIDIGMEGFNGLDLIEKLLYERPDANIVILINQCSEFLRERLSSLGVKNFLNKPFNFKEILIMLKNIELKNITYEDYIRTNVALN